MTPSNPISAAILGVVEGVTEFLPISSTGHLIVAADLLKFNSAAAFEIIIQFGAVIAVIWFYRRALLEQARQLSHDRSVQHFWLAIVLAFIPAAVVGLLLSDYLERVLFSPQVVAVSLIVGGVVLWIVEAIPKRPTTHEASQITVCQALIVGFAQLTALIPGVSRSSATTVGGLDRPAATGFSFHLAMPTLGAATLYSLVRDVGAISGAGFIDLAIGLVVLFITALFAIGWLLRYVAHHDFRGFAVYRIVAGIVDFAGFWVALTVERRGIHALTLR